MSELPYNQQFLTPGQKYLIVGKVFLFLEKGVTKPEGFVVVAEDEFIVTAGERTGSVRQFVTDAEGNVYKIQMAMYGSKFIKV